MTADTSSVLGVLRDIENLGKEEFKKWKVTTKEFIKEIDGKPEKIVDDLNPAENGEASEKAHGASYQTQLGFHCHLQIDIMICANHKMS